MEKLTLLLLVVCMLLSLASCRPVKTPPDESFPVVNPPENTEPDKIGDSLSFNPPPETGDLFENVPTPVIKMFSASHFYNLRQGQTLQESFSSCSMEMYVTYCRFDDMASGRHISKYRETGELTSKNSIIMDCEGPWQAYRYALSASAIFAATPITQALDSLEIHEIFCGVNGNEVFVQFITNYGEYVLYQNPYDWIWGGKTWEQWRPYLMPATDFYEFITDAEEWEHGAITEGLSEEYLVGDFAVEDWSAEWDKSLYDVWDAVTK